MRLVVSDGSSNILCQLGYPGARAGKSPTTIVMKCRGGAVVNGCTVMTSPTQTTIASPASSGISQEMDDIPPVKARRAMKIPLRAL